MIARIYETTPAARDVQIIFRTDVLARQTGLRRVFHSVRAALRDNSKGEIAQGSARCCYLHAATSLIRAVKKDPVYADAPPPYSRSSSPISYCSA